MGNFSAIWEEHKKFIIAVGASAIVILLFFVIFISPANKSAQGAKKKAEKKERRLKNLFKAPADEQPTESVKRKYQTFQGSLRTLEEEMISDVSFPVEAPFVLPQGESQPTVYFSSVHDQTREEVKNLADLHAIELVDLNLGFDKPPQEDKDCADALVVLSMVRQASLAAIEARVASIQKVLLKAGKERSIQIHDRRIEERIISMEVRGTPASVMRWMKLLQKRGAFLLVVSSEISRLREGELIKGTVDFARMSMVKVELSDDEEEEDTDSGSGRGRRRGR